MSDEEPRDLPDLGELDLIDDDDEVLEPDSSDEATTEAGLTEEGVELAPTDTIEFEEDNSGVA